MTRLEKIQVGLIVAGIGLVLIGANWKTTGLVNLGLLLGGAGVLSSGIDTLVSNRVGFWSRISRDLYGSGARAMLTGILLTLIGIWVWALASVRLLGMESQAGAFLTSHPGLSLLNIALFLILLGVFGFFRLEGWQASLQNILRALPILLISGLLLIIGLSTLVIGLYALVNPGAIQEWVTSWIPPNIYLQR